MKKCPSTGREERGRPDQITGDVLGQFVETDLWQAWLMTRLNGIRRNM